MTETEAPSPAKTNSRKSGNERGKDVKTKSEHRGDNVGKCRERQLGHQKRPDREGQGIRMAER